MSFDKIKGRNDGFNQTEEMTDLIKQNSQSIYGSPLINSSSSLSWKIDIKSRCISSLNPSKNAFI